MPTDKVTNVSEKSMNFVHKNFTRRMGCWWRESTSSENQTPEFIKGKFNKISQADLEREFSPFEFHQCLCRYVEEISSAAMLATKRSEGVAPEVNLREHQTYMPPPSVKKAVHSGFETQMRRHQKSKRGVSVAPQKGLISSKSFIK